jgi:hypothetical protein
MAWNGVTRGFHKLGLALGGPALLAAAINGLFALQVGTTGRPGLWDYVSWAIFWMVVGCFLYVLCRLIGWIVSGFASQP